MNYYVKPGGIISAVDVVTSKHASSRSAISILETPELFHSGIEKKPHTRVTGWISQQGSAR